MISSDDGVQKIIERVLANTSSSSSKELHVENVQLDADHAMLLGEALKSNATVIDLSLAGALALQQGRDRFPSLTAPF